ncbi:MAG: SDR family NAD(P)-dependent oxidoreductase [Flavobacteriaceae bacterium]
MIFKDKVVLVTGAASGIGQATALNFAKEGAQVVVSDINEIGGEKTRARIVENGGKAMFIPADIAQSDQVNNLMKTIISSYGRLDIAINNAGVGGVYAKTADYPLEDFNRVIQINTASVFYCMKAQIAIMEKQQAGVIVNTASIAGLKGLPNSIAYTASKHAVVGMTKTAAMEYGKKNIRINAICPVFTVTPMFDPEALEQVAAGVPEKLKRNLPMKRFAQVQEQVDAILWLASEKASFVTGLALPVDGGLTA